MNRCARAAGRADELCCCYSASVRDHRVEHRKHWLSSSPVQVTGKKIPGIEPDLGSPSHSVLAKRGRYLPLCHEISLPFLRKSRIVDRENSGHSNSQRCGGREAGRERKADGTVPMAGNGRGSLNARLNKLQDAGLHEELSLRMVGNLHPKKLAKHQKILQEMAENLKVAHKTLKKTSGQWRRATQVNFAVQQCFRAVPIPSLTPQCVADRLQQFSAGESNSASCLPLQETRTSDASSSIRSDRDMRLRTFKLDGPVANQPANGSWYQTSEAVEILYEITEICPLFSLSVDFVSQNSGISMLDR